MSKKSLFLMVLVLILAGVSLFFVLRQRPQAPTSPTPTHSESDMEPNKWMATETTPTLKQSVGPKYNLDMLGLPKSTSYTSQVNQFSIEIPEGTQVEERNEGAYTITYLRPKETQQVIEIRSYSVDVYAGNLEESIKAGKSGYLLTGGFNRENQVRCPNSDDVCFLSKLYSQSTDQFPEPRLMRVVQQVVSKTPFPKFYTIEMGAYYSELTEKDLAIFNMIHQSFHLIR